MPDLEHEVTEGLGHNLRSEKVVDRVVNWITNK